MHLTLALPALNQEQSEHLPPLSTPALNELLRFGTFTPHPCSASAFSASLLWRGSLLTHAKQTLGIPQERAAAFASPVWQQMGMQSVSMLGGTDLGISRQQADAFCTGLNGFYADAGWRFYVYRPDLWLLTLPSPPDWQAPCILDVLGPLDGSARAEGTDAAQWLRYQTEIQMWLHACPVNTERTAQQQPAINGIWLWQDLNGMQTEFPPLYTDSAWAAAYSGSTTDLPHDFAAWQRAVAEQPFSDRHLIFSENLTGTRQTADVWTYKQTLETWDERFFAPLWQALKQGSLQSFTLATDGGSGGTLTVKAKAGRAFWKRKRDFQGCWFK